MFVAFEDNEGKEQIKFAKVDEEQRILLGAVLVPDMPIYRKDDKHGEYYVFMSKSTVRESAERYLRLHTQHETTLHHDVKVEDCCVVESWIKEGNHDKSMNYGLDYPEGTWVVAMKVSEDIWNNYVKTGEVKGFSIEAGYANRMQIKESDMFSEIEGVLKGQ